MPFGTLNDKLAGLVGLSGPSQSRSLQHVLVGLPSLVQLLKTHISQRSSSVKKIQNSKYFNI